MNVIAEASERSILRVLYFRPHQVGYTLLDERVFDFAARHRDCVRLVVRHSDERGHLFGRFVDGRSPTVLFVRDGRALADLVGVCAASQVDGVGEAALAEEPVLRKTGS